MVLLRLVARPDRPSALAALGIAMAVLVPLAMTLVVSGLEPRVDPQGQWLLVADGDEGVVVPDGAVAAVRYVIEDGDGGERFVVPVHGPAPPPGSAWRVGEGDGPVTWRGASLEVTPGSHPLALDGDIVVPRAEGPADAILLPRHGAGSVPARGADAFEHATIGSLRSDLVWLIVATAPLAALVAASFADLDARRHAKTAATFSALGRPGLGRWLVALRAMLLCAIGGALATVIGYVLWSQGGTFRPRDTKPLLVAFSIAAPVAMATVAAVWIGIRRIGDPNRQLRAPSRLPVRGRRLGFLPTGARPLLLGTRIVPILVMAALLFSVDLGFPMAAADIPESIAGDADEWVLGAQAGLVTSGAADARRGHVLMHHPAVAASVAETMLPTLVDGQPIVLRGARWDDVARFHELELHGTADGLVLGRHASERLGLEVGDDVAVQASRHPGILRMEVTGILTGHRTLEDEGVVPEEEASRLSGLGPGQATVVRVRPATQASLEALRGGPGVVEVTTLDVPQAVEGTVVHATVGVQNLGGSPAQRQLVVRVDGDVVAQRLVAMQAFSVDRVAIPFVMPPGGGTVTVNPVAQAAAVANPVTVEVPEVRAGAPFVVQVHNVDPGTRVGVHASLESWTSGQDALDEAPLDEEGNATLLVQEPGDALLVVGSGTYLRTITAVGPGQGIVVGRVWFDGPQVPGRLLTLHVELQNLGDVPTTRAVDLLMDGTRFGRFDVALGPGQHTTLETPFVYREGNLSVGERVVVLGAAATPAPTGGVTGSDQLRESVADRVLGDARQALGSLGLVAILSSLAVLYLSTTRTLEERRYVRDVLRAMGQEELDVRRRVVWEAGVLGAVALLLAIGIVAFAFWASGAIGWPVVFAHRLGVPFSPLFTVQAATLFAAASAAAAYVGVGQDDARPTLQVR